MAESNISMILWRGIMGGLLGNLVKSAVFGFYYGYINTAQSGYLRKSEMVTVFAFLGMPSAIIVSVIIVAVIRTIKLKLRRHIGFFVGAVIGVGLTGALVVVLLTLQGLPLDNALIDAPFYDDFGVIIGAIAGMMAWQRNKMRWQ